MKESYEMDLCASRWDLQWVLTKTVTGLGLKNCSEFLEYYEQLLVFQEVLYSFVLVVYGTCNISTHMIQTSITACTCCLSVLL
jgi:hypothetical protein